MIASFHNHSTWSDGRASPSQMYTSAKKLGVELFGLSDHLCVYPDGTSPSWSLPAARISEYLRDVRALRENGGPEVIVGLECDWFEAHERVLAPVVNSVDLDYRIGSVHHVWQEQFDVDLSFWSSRSREERDEVFVAYWKLIAEMAMSSLFDIAAHLDLPKKLGFYPSGAVEQWIDLSLDAIKAHRLIVELNTAGFGKPCADGYPSADILRRCRQREIPITLSSDAHIPEHILYEFERGLAALSVAGYREVARIRNREIWFESLERAATKGG